MTRSELPHTVSSHPLLSLDITLNTPCVAEEPFIAGDLLQGTLQLTARSERIALGEIGVELVVEAEAKTSFDRAHEVLYDQSVVYQGANLPLSRAVYPGDIEGLPGFHKAKRGVTRFPISLPIPAQLPSSYASPYAGITYTLYATSHFASESKGIVQISTPLDVVQSSLLLKEDHLAAWRVEDRSRLPLDEGGGSLILSARHDRGWILSDQREVEVHVALVNTTSSWTLPPIIRLVKHTTINFRHDPFEADEIITREQFDRHIVAPHTEQRLSLQIALPVDLRSTESPIFSVRYHLFVLVALGNGRSVEAKLPVEIMHPASVAVEQYFAAATAAVEAHHRLVRPPVERRPPVKRKRWSMPAGASFASFLSPLLGPQVYPAPSPPRLPPGEPTYAYPQPAFVVHQLSPIIEEHETKAERTSRHLRETSGSRGRSVSPPLPTPDLQVQTTGMLQNNQPDRPRSAGFGPRPMPRRSSTSAIPKIRSAFSPDCLVVPETILPIVEKPLLFVDQQGPPVGQDSSSPEEVKEPLEDRVGEAQAEIPLVSPSASPVKSRRSVFELFASNPSPVPASFGKLAMVGPSGSARGGRGGQVTSLREVFKGLNLGEERVVERPKAVKRMSLPIGLGAKGSQSCSREREHQQDWRE